MKHSLEIFVYLRPLICSKDNCEKCISNDVIHHSQLDDPDKKENVSIQTVVKSRRARGKQLFRVKQLGVEDMVNEMLKDEQMTLKDIAEAVYKNTGQQISKAAISRYYHNK